MAIVQYISAENKVFNIYYLHSLNSTLNCRKVERDQKSNKSCHKQQEFGPNMKSFNEI